MTPETLPEAAPKGGSFPAAVDSLKARFPKATDGILFCIYKLEQDPGLKIPDFRDEARKHGISLGGRALHAAKLLLGLKTAAPKPSGKTKPGGKAKKRKPRPVKQKGGDVSLEDQVMQAITQIQASATDQSARLREAMRQAIRVLEDALDE